MPIKLELALREGWKATENNRLGEALEVRFISTEDNKIMFRYAPNLSDKVFWEIMFKRLNLYDKKLKEIRNIIDIIVKEPLDNSVGGCK